MRDFENRVIRPPGWLYPSIFSVHKESMLILVHLRGFPHIPQRLMPGDVVSDWTKVYARRIHESKRGVKTRERPR
jgi:hypothetical protein